MDDAGFITAQIAWGKAYTAVAFRAMSPQFPDGLVIQQWFKERNPQMMITLQSSPMAGSSPRAVARRCSRATSWSAHTAFRVARRIKTRRWLAMPVPGSAGPICARTTIRRMTPSDRSTSFTPGLASTTGSCESAPDRYRLEGLNLLRPPASKAQLQDLDARRHEQ